MKPRKQQKKLTAYLLCFVLVFGLLPMMPGMRLTVGADYNGEGSGTNVIKLRMDQPQR